MHRRPIVAANWKMHKTLAEANELACSLRARLRGVSGPEIVICPPFTALRVVGEVLAGSGMQLGAQNVHAERQGAYTGEISVAMLQDLACRYIIVGHSERRALFDESDAVVNAKARAVLEAGLTPIVCVGESLQQREAGRTEAVLREQIEGSLAGLAGDLSRIVVAYEPVWAIGTGRTATPDQAQQAHRFIRGLIEQLAGAEIAAALRIQYGGSVKPGNAAELFSAADVDGGLIGGASLDAESFARIVEAI